MPRAYYKRDYDLYRLSSYREFGAWREFFNLLTPILLLFGIVFGGILFVGVQNGLSATPIVVAKFASLAIGAALGATVLLIGSKHPNPLIRNLIQASPILLLGVMYLVG